MNWLYLRLLIVRCVNAARKFSMLFQMMMKVTVMTGRSPTEVTVIFDFKSVRYYLYLYLCYLSCSTILV